MMLRRITLPPSVVDAMKTPFRFPPILFFSIKLSLLLPTSPTPKLLLILSPFGSVTVEVADPFPLRIFNRTRLLWLLAIQVPPQGAPSEPIEFRTETFLSMSLSVVPPSRMPLKQLSDAVTPSTLTLVDPPRNIPSPPNFWTRPGPRMATSCRPITSMPS